MEKLKQIVSEDNLNISRSTTQSSTVERQYTDAIPVDLLIDILLRVPSKSIARFRCVSKSWANLLRQPYFTELFLSKSVNHPRLLFTFQVDRKFYFFSCPQNADANSSLVATRYQNNSLESFGEIISSLRGLVCRQYWIKDYNRKPVMYNPVTREFLTLPRLKTHILYPKFYCGYDPTDKQFKLLCVSSESKSTEAHVLTLNTRKNLWRMIKCTAHYPMLYSRGICIDGVLYYLAAEATQIMIVCFDVRSEKFSFIITDDGSLKRSCTLVNYKGKLGGVQFEDSDRRNLQFWLVEKDGSEYKWSTNVYNLTRLFRLFYIVGMTGTGDIVLAPYYLSGSFYVFYYNVERKDLTGVEIQGFQEFKHLCLRVSTFQDYVEDVKLMKMSLGVCIS